MRLLCCAITHCEIAQEANIVSGEGGGRENRENMRFFQEFWQRSESIVKDGSHVNKD